MENKQNTQEIFTNYPDVVDVNTLALMLGNIGTQSAYKLLHKGVIKAVKIGKLYRIPKINIITFISQNN